MCAWFLALDVADEDGPEELMEGVRVDGKASE